MKPLHFMQIFVLIALAGFSGCSPGQQSRSGQLPLLPYPQEITRMKGHFHPAAVISIRSSGITAESDPVLFTQLDQSIHEAYGIRMQKAETGLPDIWIGLPDRDEALKSLCEKESIWPDERIGEEGYVLKISAGIILIAANTSGGLFYGAQTLRQLLRGYPGKPGIPAMLITDWPCMPVRAIMDDISRGPIPSNDYIKDQIRRYSELKINHMSFYIEHVVRTEKHPGFAPAGGALSIGEIRDLSEYAADYHIKLIGSFQSLGHFEKILSVPEFRHLGATDRMLDPLNPQAMDFLRDVYREMAPAFSSEWFTPNCDEAWDLSRTELTGEAARLGVARIYSDHIRRIDTTLSELGKRSLIWGDVILEFPDILELLPPHVVIGTWNYDALGSFAEFIDPFRNAGFEFTVSPGILNSNRLFPDYREAFVNIRNFIHEGHAKGASGVYCTIWDDGGPHFFNHDWYGVAYAAEQSWSPNRNATEPFDDRFSRAFYGDPRNSVPEGIHELNKLAELEATYEMNELIFAKILVPEPGKSISYNMGDWEEIGEIAASASRLFSKGDIRRYADDIASLQFTCHQYLFLAESRKALLEASEYYRKADSLADADRGKTLEYLNAARELLAAQAISFKELSSAFERIWQMENRPYWFREASTVYERRNQAFGEQLKNLDEAVSAYRQGESLPPADQISLDVRQHSDQFFQFWLICGPFPGSGTEGLNVDFLEPAGGEARARPYPGMEFTALPGNKARWRKYDSPYRHLVDMSDACPTEKPAVSYAYCSLDSPGDQLTGSILVINGGAALFCNGEKIFEHLGMQSPVPQRHEIMLPLKAGRNHILLKIQRVSTDWNFSFGIKGEEVRNHKQKYLITRIQENNGID